MSRRVKDWLESYLRYTKDHESPESYHFWSGALVIAGAVRRNVWLDRGFYKIFPNLYVVLVAESARLRKSTALEIGEPFLRQVQGVQLIHERITFEKLVECLNRSTEGQPDGTAFIFAPELTMFLGGGDDNTRKLIGFLVSVHGGKDMWEYSTIARDRRVLKNVLLTIAGASTPDYLRQIPQDAVGGGFAGRIIWIGGDKRKTSVAWPDEVKPSKDVEIELMDTLLEIVKVKGAFEVEKKAREFYREWYDNLDEPTDPRLSGFTERMHDQVLRVAMILSLSESSALKLSETHIKKSVGLIEDVLYFMPRVLEFVGTTEHSRDAERIIKQLRKAGGEMMHGRLLEVNSWKLSAEELKKLMQTLVERGTVVAHEAGKGTLYRLKEKKK